MLMKRMKALLFTSCALLSAVVGGCSGGGGDGGGGASAISTEITPTGFVAGQERVVIKKPGRWWSEVRIEADKTNDPNATTGTGKVTFKGQGFLVPYDVTFSNIVATEETVEMDIRFDLYLSDEATCEVGDKFQACMRVKFPENLTNKKSPLATAQAPAFDMDLRVHMTFYKQKGVAMSGVVTVDGNGQWYDEFGNYLDQDEALSEGFPNAWGEECMTGGYFSQMISPR